MKDFNKCLESEEIHEKVKALREKVENFAINFPMPGHADL